jgi:PadR family transcriptional regulator PadR
MGEASFFILTALLGEPRHGYGIVKEVDELSEGRVRLRIGSLYGMLERLVTEGAVELDREEPMDGRLRRYYRVTPGGRGLLATETARMDANAKLATRRLNATA